GVLALMYDMIYYYCFPYVEFSDVHDPGVWFSCDVDYVKTSGQVAQVGQRNTAPFNNVHYYIGGSPSPNPPADAWGGQRLSDGIRVWSQFPDASKLTISHGNLTDADGFILHFDAQQRLLVNFPALILAAEREFNRRLNSLLQTLQLIVKEQLE